MKKLLILPLCLFSLCLVAQIEFLEPSTVVAPIDASKEWEHMNVYRHYDSTDFVVQSWPVIEAYKKYVGQTIFFLGKKSGSVYYGHNMTEDNKTLNPKQVIMLSNEKKKEEYLPYKKGKLTELFNKYYVVVDVVSYLDEGGNPKKCFVRMKQTGYRTYKFPCKDDSEKNCSSTSEVPCFVLVNKETGDTCYTAFPEKFILVNAFIKVQAQFERAKLNYIHRSAGKSTVENWRCVKVAVASRDFFNFPQYENIPTVSFIVQNDKGVQKAVPVKEYLNMRWWLTETPVLVSDVLYQKKTMAEESKCCNELVIELEKKYSTPQEIKANVPVTTEKSNKLQIKPKKTPPRIRRN